MRYDRICTILPVFYDVYKYHMRGISVLIFLRTKVNDVIYMSAPNSVSDVNTLAGIHCITLTHLRKLNPAKASVLTKNVDIFSDVSIKNI